MEQRRKHRGVRRWPCDVAHRNRRGTLSTGEACKGRSGNGTIESCFNRYPWIGKRLACRRVQNLAQAPIRDFKSQCGLVECDLNFHGPGTPEYVIPFPLYPQLLESPREADKRPKMITAPDQPPRGDASAVRT